MPTNYLSVFDHFVGLALKGLNNFFNQRKMTWSHFIIQVTSNNIVLQKVAAPRPTNFRPLSKAFKFWQFPDLTILRLFPDFVNKLSIPFLFRVFLGWWQPWVELHPDLTLISAFFFLTKSTAFKKNSTTKKITHNLVL